MIKNILLDNNKIAVWGKLSSLWRIDKRYWYPPLSVVLSEMLATPLCHLYPNICLQIIQFII